MVHLPLVSEANLNGKVVLIRVDHNVVKDGKIKDFFRLDRSKKTIDYVLENHGFPILMSHFGRPRNAKTNEITISEEESAGPVVDYIEKEWGLRAKLVKVDAENAPKTGLTTIPKTANKAIQEMREGIIDVVYLPNTRWFEGEESKGAAREKFSKELADLADIYVYDAFGSWQPHASTFDITKYLPSYAGFLVQEEVEKLKLVTNPKKPFLAAIAGEKIDTKIGSILALHKKADYIILGGLPNNALLCAKYNISINGISQEETNTAKKLIEDDKGKNKILLMRHIVESYVEGAKEEGKFREIDVTTLKQGQKLNFVYDIAKTSFYSEDIKNGIEKAETIFVNAVMGYDKAGYTDGTRALFESIGKNSHASIFFGGGDTLKALKKLTPEFYERALKDKRYFLFTGGGTILSAIEDGSPYMLPTIKALIENKKT